MDIRRVGLYAALALVVYSLWSNWQLDYTKDSNQIINAPLEHSFTEETANTARSFEETPISNTASVITDMVRVKTDVMNLAIDLKQGDVINAELLAYPADMLEKNKPFILLKNDTNAKYVAESHIFVVNDKKIQDLNFNFHSAKVNYELPKKQENLVVTLEGSTKDGLTVQKEFRFKRGSYLIEVRYIVMNNGTAAWKGYMSTELLQKAPTEDKSSMFHVGSFTGASYSNPGQHRYKKITFKDMSKENLDLDATGGWIAMQQHYFLSTWIPDPSVKNRFYTRYSNNDYMIGAVTPAINLAPMAKTILQTRLYLGPEVTDTLKAIAPGLDLTVDYGWLWFLSAILFTFMTKIYSVVGNWGWSIVLVTVLIKLAFYKLSATSYKSMAGMRKLQPKLLAMRERYGDDKAKISQATMALYREEKVNPLGGCLPIIIQIPVFIALYSVLLESVQLRQAPFIFWIADLASSDPYHVLPVIMGITMLIQQRLNPAPPDPMQAKIMMFLPILFTGLFWNFPAGLVLYWIVNNSLSILQQWYITRKYSEIKPKTPNKPVKKLSIVK